MVPPHILDRLVEAHRIPTGDATVKAAAQQKGKGRKKRETQRPDVITLPDEALRRDLAHSIVRCTSFYMLEQPEELVAHSAAFLEAVMRLWGERNIDATEVWREIDHRLQLGNLLTQINSDIPHSPETARKFWRPSSTKLP
ncbi:hypothetical protein [Asaia siamensis]|uniref:Uncharacterized protein n=2 Tax=Asaia siamensis TaxID=110479 RepID=A0ABQ1M2T7_9PROT|nr:hypothetical protein [Asaia siamensis]GBR10386.1 hypothetical protein AA0323_2793 [Asaia siamensis NRIC 0323]GGC33354.1 hypothetical protein GCM10007207_18560 [Asaia siamensis]